jgi:EAL domain
LTGGTIAIAFASRNRAPSQRRRTDGPDQASPARSGAALVRRDRPCICNWSVPEASAGALHPAKSSSATRSSALLLRRAHAGTTILLGLAEVIVKSVVQMAQGLGKKTIAEFVEDEPTLDLLRDYGVDYAQGYHIAKPAPLETIALDKTPAGIPTRA